MTFYSVHITNECYGVYFMRYSDALKYYDEQDHDMYLWTITTCYAN